MNFKTFLVAFVILVSSTSYAKTFSKDMILKQLSLYRPNYYLGFNIPQGVLARNYKTGFTFGINAFHRENILGALHPGLNFSVNFLPSQSDDYDSYIDVNILPSVRYYQPGNNGFKNPLFVNDPMKVFAQGGIGITQWNTEGSSKLKVLDPSVSETDFSFNAGMGLTSERLEVLLLYTNIFGHTNNIKYFTLSVGLSF